MSKTDESRVLEEISAESIVDPVQGTVDPRTSYLLRNYHLNGQLVEEAIVINGNVEGIKKLWYPNGRMSVRLGFRRGRLHGPRHMWGENGELLEEEFYVNGKRQGVFRRYASDGQILLETNYEEDLPHGRNRIWFPNGQLQHEEFFNKGFRSSIQKEWYSNGNIKCISEYMAGKLNGSSRCWHRNGRLKAEEVFVDGVLQGISRYWDPEGHIRHRASNLRGRLHGEQVDWDETGKQTLRQFYSRGVRIPAVYEKLILSNELTARHIVEIQNAEVRRICLEALGYSRFLAQLPHRVIQRKGAQELITIDWHEREEPLCLVKVRCPTTGAFYVLRVPPNMRTVRQAVAWTFGVSEKDYQPVEEA